MKCLYCLSKCIKKGRVKNGQRYQCKICGRTQQQYYVKARIDQEKYQWIQKLNNEGCSISSISRLVRIAKSSVQRIMEQIASSITIPIYHETNQLYEVDELRTYCRSKRQECWLIYGINRSTGKVIDFKVGKRTKENIRQVVDTLLQLNPKRIYTDGLNIYPTLIPKPIHRVFDYCINKIERHNLTLRTHLKRLNRKTICFSKSEQMLENCMKMYWFV